MMTNQLRMSSVVRIQTTGPETYTKFASLYKSLCLSRAITAVGFADADRITSNVVPVSALDSTSILPP